MKRTVADLDRLDTVLADAGRAHHAAYLETGGEDPNWPTWYAEHLVEDVRSILGLPDLTRSRLVVALVDADAAYTSHPQAVPWHRFYAERLADDLR